jgi:hypothetical protein
MFPSAWYVAIGISWVIYSLQLLLLLLPALGCH